MVAATIVNRHELLWCPRCSRETLEPSIEPGRWRCYQCKGIWTDNPGPSSSLIDHWTGVFERASRTGGGQTSGRDSSADARRDRRALVGRAHRRLSDNRDARFSGTAE